MYHTITGLELFVFQVQQADCDLQPPHAFKLCQHDIPQPNCCHTTASLVCPCPDDIKYRMTRLSIDALDICIVESGTAIEIEVRFFKLLNIAFFAKKILYKIYMFNLFL